MTAGLLTELVLLDHSPLKGGFTVRVEAGINEARLEYAKEQARASKHTKWVY